MPDINVFALKKWKLVCPKCNHIEDSQADGKLRCGNCEAPAKAYYAISSSGTWKSEDARKSWRALGCSKKCGWSVAKIDCSKCGVSISGDFIQGKGINQGNVARCFVATACFEDVEHPTVNHLRMFRDGHLNRYRLGQNFIAWYYKNGPQYARWVSDKPRIKAGLRFTFNQLVRVLPKR